MNGCASGFRMSPVNAMQTTISQPFSTSFGDLAQQAIRAQSLIPSNIGQRITVLDYIRDTYTCTSPRSSYVDSGELCEKVNQRNRKHLLAPHFHTAEHF